MRFHVLTIFPEMFPGPLAVSVLGRGVAQGVFSVCVHDIRAHGEGRHRVVDDAPFGGGPGMVMKPGPLAASIEEARAEAVGGAPPVVLLDPQGTPLTQEIADSLAVVPDLVLVCGHYEGVDERIKETLVTDQVSIGDYVLTGGELAAMVLIDAVARRIPGVLGSEDSGQQDTFAFGLLQHPQYTRPADFRGSRVPEVLVSGNHAEVARWRRRQSLLRTLQRRPDLLTKADLTIEERRWLMDQGWEPTA